MRSIRPPKLVVRTLVSMVVLLVLLLAAGAGYVWYSGQNTATMPVTPPEATAAAAPVPHAPPKPAANAPASAMIEMLTSPVAPGEMVALTVKTVPTAVCKVSVMYDKTASRAAGLTDQTADDYGVANWNWTVDANAPKGKWPVKVMCYYHDKSAMVQGDLDVAP